MRKLLVPVLIWLLAGWLVIPAAIAETGADDDDVSGPDAAVQETGDPDDLEAQVAEILGRPVDDEADDMQACLSRTRYREIEVLDNQTLAFIGRGDDVWLNQLRSPCSGLSDRLSLELHTTGGLRYCRMDGFYGIDPSMVGRGLGRGFHDPGALHSRDMQTARRTGRCMLGGFERISRDQLDLLREALDGDRARRTD